MRKNLFWEIILRPWLFSIVPQIFDRWEICRAFFDKFDKVKFKFHFVQDYKINYLFSRPYYRSAQIDDYWNQNIFSKIIRENYFDRIIEEKSLKTKKVEKEKMNIYIKNIAYFPMIFFDSKLINQNEIIFDTNQTRHFNFLKLCRNLKIFPITLFKFF